MTEHYLFYTVGNRDLYIDKSLPAKERFRSACEEFLTQLKADPDQVRRVEAPQLKNCLEYLAQVEQVSELARVYLAVTDKNPDPRYQESDTAAAGEILVRWLESLKSGSGFRRLLGKAAFKLLIMADINPSDYAAVHRWFRQKLPELQPGVFWLHPVSGTPAMTIGLVLAAVSRWGEAVQVLYQTPGGSVEKNPIHLDIFVERVRAKLLDRLEGLDFAGAAGALGWLPPDRAGAVRLLVTAGLERSRFNFNAADRLLAEAVAQTFDGALREEVRQLRARLRPLLERPDSAAATRPFLVELVFNARACWVAGREVDFLGRIYRLHEGLARYLLESLDFPTDESPGRREQTRRAFWGRVRELGLPVESPPADPAVNRPTMVAVLRAVVERRPAGLDVSLAERFLPWLEGVLAELADVRNRTILGHGFEPVSREDLERLVREKTGLEVRSWLEEMARALEPDPRDPFEATVGIVRRMLGG